MNPFLNFLYARMYVPRVFYEMMHYPVPLRQDFFAFQETTSSLYRSDEVLPIWSWLFPPTEQMSVYLSYIQKRQWIWSYIPFVDAVYLSNSISFNALKENSNIDFFVVATPGRMWCARICTLAITAAFGLIRIIEPKEKEWTFNFWLTRDQQDLKQFLLQPSDPYLVYWIAHLVPIYFRELSCDDEIYEINDRLQYYLPNFPRRQVIFLGIEKLYGISWIKKWVEQLTTNRFGDMLDYVFRSAHAVRLYFWKKKYKERIVHLLNKKSLFRIYDDKRKWYALMRELRKKEAMQSSEDTICYK